MKIMPICPYSFAANTYMCISGSHAVVIDPTVSINAIKNALNEYGATLDSILLTHGHFDHTVSVDTLRDAFGVPLLIHKNDAIMLTDGKKNAYYDFYGRECVHRAADSLLSDGDVISVGDEILTVIHTPGHSEGSICLLNDGFLITGDTLFADSIGRCDLFGGSIDKIKLSLDRLRLLDGNFKIYPGHGEPAILGRALDNAAYFT